MRLGRICERGSVRDKGLGVSYNGMKETQIALKAEQLGFTDSTRLADYDQLEKVFFFCRSVCLQLRTQASQ